jgi:peroxiredoxin
MDTHREAQESQSVESRMAALSPAEGWQPDTSRGWAQLEANRRANKARAWRWLLAGAGAGASCMALMSLPGPRVFAHKCIDCSVSVWHSVLASAPVVPTKLQAESERKPAPDFSLEDEAGKTVKVSDFKGRVLLLNFWATWCHGCKTEIPWFLEFQREFDKKDFAVLGVAMDDDGWKSVRPYMIEKNITYEMVVGNDDIAARFGGLQGLPISFLIDRQGRIAAKHIGMVEREECRREIEQLMKELVTAPAAAR